MAKRLKELSAKGSQLRIKDLKVMLKEFKSQNEERIVRQEKRREDVRHMIGVFKKERNEAASNWQEMEKMLARRKSGLLRTIHSTPLSKVV